MRFIRKNGAVFFNILLVIRYNDTMVSAPIIIFLVNLMILIGSESCLGIDFTGICLIKSFVYGGCILNIF